MKFGAAITRLFAKEGAKVAVHGRDSAALSTLRAGIEREGGIATQVSPRLASLLAQFLPAESALAGDVG